MSQKQREIEVVLGSESDLDQVQEGLEELKKSGALYRVHIISCHRNPEDLRVYARDGVTEDMIIIAATAADTADTAPLAVRLFIFSHLLC